MKVLFIAAHADDIEVTGPNTVKAFLDRGHEVIMALATCDEYAWLYGKQVNKFKGPRQAQLRINEMNRAARKYGVDNNGKAILRLHWLGWIDGYVPLNQAALKKMHDYLKRVNPDLIFAPDGFYSLDHHNDHDHVGILVYKACCMLKNKPRLYLWQSWKNDTYFPINDPSFTFIPIQGHATQFPRQRFVVKVMRLFWWVLVSLRRARSSGILAESFRKITYTPGENDVKTILDRIKHSASFILMGGPPRNIYQPPPESFGLKRINPVIYQNWLDYSKRVVQ